ncbi:MAG: HEAT repeat domain-containing protein [Planctomycetota bacterium]
MRTHRSFPLLLAALLAAAPALANEKEFLKAAKSNDRAGMVKAAEGIADAPDAKGLKALVMVGALVESSDVYSACREAIAKAAQGELLKEVEKLLKASKRTEQKTLCIDGLGGSGNKDAVPALAGALDDKDKVVRISAIMALTRMQLKECIPPLFERLNEVGFKSKDAEAEELYDSLHKLTGQAFEALEDWKKWWETVQGDFDPKNKKTDAGSGTRMRDSSGEGKIFESMVRSQAFVLVLDISSSMRVIDLPEGESWKDPKSGKELKYKDPDPKGTKAPVPDSRFVRAQDAFCKFIEGMSERARFAIVVFADEKETRLWKPDVVPASASNKKSAIAFVRGLKWSGATRTDMALDLAFKVKGADTIYLFSDGIPEKTQGGKSVDIPQDEVLEKARTLNRARKLRLNCYGMTSSGKTRAFLEKLASENGGEYKDIRVPAKKKP